MNGMVATMRALALGLLLAAAAFVAPRARADEPLAANLREEVLALPKPGAPGVTLETTLFRPPGDGPFPLVVINHGKLPGETHAQPRQRYLMAAREFVARGYAVAVPMRQGFAQSGGAYIGDGCDVEANGVAQADDIAAAIAELARRPDIDARRVVVMGQSHGGLATLALGARNLPRVAGLVNFAGGLRQDDCAHWQRDLVTAMHDYGLATRVPSLWFYGDNDHYFDPDTWHRMEQAYTSAGGPARLVAFGAFHDDAHTMFASADGLRVWLPEVGRFFQQLGLPFDAIYDVDGAPAGSDFAAIDDVARVPFLGPQGRAGYAAFLAKPLPRAFALSPDGAWAYRDGDNATQREALAECRKRAARANCRLYAVDRAVVWHDGPIESVPVPVSASTPATTATTITAGTIAATH